MTSPILTLTSVCAGYTREVNILEGVDMSVNNGELIAIIGSNGAGKSTLARTIFGLVPLSGGTIEFLSQSIVGTRAQKLVTMGMGYVPQVSNVFPSLTVSENLEMGAFEYKGNVGQQKQEIFGIFPLLERKQKQKAGTLSGGERQMLAMGRALMISPKLLILDEPSAALAPILVQEIFDLIVRINHQGTTILLVEQNARKALAIADRGYVMDSGKIAYEGKGQDLLHDPKIAELYLGTKKPQNNEIN